MKVGFISLGCPKNQVDTEIMIGLLKNAGHRIVNSIEKAEIVVINTCGFINDAKEEAINAIIDTGKLRRGGRLQYILATGCLAQRYSQELLDEMPELDGLLGISSFIRIDQAVSAVSEGQRINWVEDPPSTFVEKGPRVLTTPPGSAYLKISEGCNNCCSYCAIPQIRGRFRSKGLPDIEEEAAKLAADGVKELVVVGQDTGMYGCDLPNNGDLPQLLKRLGSIDGLEWIRLMYLHPQHINDQLIEVIAQEKKVIPYLDIPIQHAADKVLAAMNRKHGREYLYDLLHRLKQNIPELVLRTTVMVGFPGETQGDFEQLFSLVKTMEFDWLGVFAYNAEENTPAFDLEDQVPEEIKQERKAIIMREQMGITRKKNIARIDRIEPILISESLERNLYLGRGYFQAPGVDGVTMVRSSRKLEKGSMVRVRLKAVRNYDMIGELCDEHTELPYGV